MRLIYFDTETTGLNPVRDRIIELACIIIEDGKTILEYDEFINVGIVLSEDIVELTGITDDLLVREGLDEEFVAYNLFSFMSGCDDVLMIAHNCQFDLCFVYELLCRYFPKCDVDVLFEGCGWLDTLTVFKDRKGFPHKLSDLVEYYNLGEFRFHRAIDDCSVLPVALNVMFHERGDVLEYVNVFGFNPRYGVFGVRFPFIRYVRQFYHDGGMVRSCDILPFKG